MPQPVRADAVAPAAATPSAVARRDRLATGWRPCRQILADPGLLSAAFALTLRRSLAGPPAGAARATRAAVARPLARQPSRARADDRHALRRAHAITYW